MIHLRLRNERLRNLVATTLLYFPNHPPLQQINLHFHLLDFFSSFCLPISSQNPDLLQHLWLPSLECGELPESFTVTDPCISGQPIVFASKGFLKIMGFSKSEVIGKNGRIFQGPGTCSRSMMEIREAIREERGVQINLVNYRRDGTPFWMLFHMCPVFSKEDGRVIHYVGVQVPILRKPRRRNAVGLVYEEESRVIESVYGSCRREVCSDAMVDLGRALSLECALDDDVDHRGCARHEVLGRNHRFSSGEDTTYQIKETVQSEKACTIRILNYRKDKTLRLHFGSCISNS